MRYSVYFVKLTGKYHVYSFSQDGWVFEFSTHSLSHAKKEIEGLKEEFRYSLPDVLGECVWTE